MTEYYLDRGIYGYNRPRMASLTQISAPEVEPVTLAQVWTQLRVVPVGSPKAFAEDAWITGIAMPAAREWVEGYLRRTLVQRTWQINYAKFPNPLELLMPPVQSVTSVKYYDDTNTLQTLDPSQYLVDVTREPAVIVPAPGVDQWPTTTIRPDAVQVTYVAGYAPKGSPKDYVANIPVRMKQAILLVIGDLFNNRESHVQMQSYANATAEALLYQDRVFTL